MSYWSVCDVDENISAWGELYHEKYGLIGFLPSSTKLTCDLPHYEGVSCWS